MLKQLISRNYHFAKKDTAQILHRVFTDYRKVGKKNHYCLEVNKRRIGFSLRSDYQNKDCNEILRASKNNNPYKSIKQWNTVSYFLLIVSIMGYILVNGKASADEEENENITDGSDLQSSEKLDGVPKKLMEGLPAPVENYVDFQSKKELLDEKLKNQDIVVISGAGGMGKSTLALQYAHCKQREIVPVIWIKGTQIEEEFFQLAKILKIQTDDFDSEMIRNLVYGDLEMLFERRSILFIFDNIEKKEKIEKYFINLPNTAKVIITARNGNLLEGITSFQPFHVKGFKTNEAIFYLKKSLKITEEEAKKIINVVGESPFRLSKTTTYLKKHNLKSIDEFLREYEESKKGRKHDSEIYPEVELLFQDLKKECYEGWRLLKYLAYLDAEGVSVEFIQNIMGQTADELEKSVNDLRKLSLMKIMTQKNETLLKVSHRIVQDETKQALIKEDVTQASKLLEKLINALDEVFPGVNDNPENWKEASQWINHAEMLVEEAKKNRFTFFKARRANIKNRILPL